MTLTFPGAAFARELISLRNISAFSKALLMWSSWAHGILFIMQTQPWALLFSLSKLPASIKLIVCIKHLKMCTWKYICLYIVYIKHVKMYNRKHYVSEMR